MFPVERSEVSRFIPDASDDGETVYRRPDGTLTSEGSKLIGQRSRARAREQRAAYVQLVKGGELRARDGVQRSELAGLAFAAAGIAIDEILCGKLGFRHAKDAADVARELVTLGRLELGLPTEGASAPQTEAERKVYMERITVLHKTLADRARAARDPSTIIETAPATMPAESSEEN